MTFTIPPEKISIALWEELNFLIKEENIRLNVLNISVEEAHKIKQRLDSLQFALEALIHYDHLVMGRIPYDDVPTPLSA